MELLRRIIFYGCVLTAIVTAMYASLEPIVLVDIYEPDKDKRSLAEKNPESLLSEEDQLAIKQKRQMDIANSTVVADSKEWEGIYENLTSLKNTGKASDKWQKRLPSDMYPLKIFFFRPYESPISEISKHLIKDNQQLYIRLKEDKLLRLEHRIYSDDDFHLGSGFSRYPRPPAWMLYPYRQYSLYIFLFGLAVYIFLPVRLISSNAIRYPRWRVMISDLVAAIMFFGFFSLPFFIVGGVKQAITIGFSITIPMWLICLLGLYLAKIALWYGSYQIDIKDDGLTIASYKGIRHFRYSEMEYFQPAIFKPPKWLIVLTWLTAFSGRGSAGRAILLSTSETGAIAVRLKDGRELYIAVTDQMGTTALKGFDEIIKMLEKKKIVYNEKMREIRSMGMEIMR